MLAIFPCFRPCRCVSAERAAEMMARGDIATPSLGDATKAAFRGQVRFQQRPRLPLLRLQTPSCYVP